MLLDEDDWFILRHLTGAMKMFKDATQALQGHAEDSEFSSIGECIPIIEQLQSRLITL
jgi:hypothetical protein